MLSANEYLDVRRLHGQGWSISAIARHLGRDRKTVRSYLSGSRVPGVRAPVKDSFLVYLPYCRRRLEDDPHLEAITLFEEIVELGYRGGYSTFTRALRRRRVRPVCRNCRPRVAGERASTPHSVDEELGFSGNAAGGTAITRRALAPRGACRIRRPLSAGALAEADALRALHNRQ